MRQERMKAAERALLTLGLPCPARWRETATSDWSGRVEDGVVVVLFDQWSARVEKAYLSR